MTDMTTEASDPRGEDDNIWVWHPEPDEVPVLDKTKITHIPDPEVPEVTRQPQGEFLILLQVRQHANEDFFQFNLGEDIQMVGKSRWEGKITVHVKLAF